MSVAWVIGAALLALMCAGALFTALFVAWTRRIFRPGGRFVVVPGGRLHVIENSAADQGAPAVVLLHGASGNALDMQVALGPALAGRYRVLAFDRPGHGWSDRPAGRADASPARQADLIAHALAQLGVTRAIVVAHSWSGALGTRLALDHPALVAGLVLLAPVTHPWPGGVTWYYAPASSRFLGHIFNRSIAAPVGSVWLKPAIASVFHPDRAPADYVERTATWLVLRPSEFRSNAQDVQDLLGHVEAQHHRYGEISVPTSIIHGEADRTVWATIHSRPISKQIEGSRLILLEGVGHMPHHTHPDLVAQEVDRIAHLAYGASPLSDAPDPPAGLPQPSASRA